MATLQSYLTATQRLLHDANFKYWSQSALIDAINAAQKRAVGDSGCYRRLQTVYLSADLELYGYGMVSGGIVTLAGTLYASVPAVTIAAPPTGGTTATATCILQSGGVAQIQVTSGGSGYVTAPLITIAAPGGGGVTATATASIVSPDTLDTMNISVLNGQQRTTLGRFPFTAVQSYARSGATPGLPQVAASYGQTQWYISPAPSQYYVSEWDTIVNPPDLASLTDVSVVQYPYSECVPYYAAHMAKFQEQSYAESDKFLEVYTRKMQYSRRSVMQRMLPSVY